MVIQVTLNQNIQPYLSMITLLIADQVQIKFTISLKG